MSHHFRTGLDGKKVNIPHGYTSREGNDGRVVPIPPGVHQGKVATVGWWQSYVARLPVKEVTGASHALQRARSRAKVAMAGSWQSHAVATVLKGQTVVFD